MRGLVNKQALAAQLGIRVRAINKQIQRGDLPRPFHQGKRWYWREEALEAHWAKLERRAKRG